MMRAIATKLSRGNSPLAGRACSALRWLAAAFLGMQLGFSIVMDRIEPALRDPEYGRKLALLKARVAEAPQRPLVLILGSSRAGLGMLPDEFAIDDADGHEAMVFNFALTGSGPIRELMALRRLLAAGIRPRQVLVEIHPLLLHGGPGFGELADLDAGRLDWPDVKLLGRYVERPGALQGKWLRARLAPCFGQRFCWLHYLAPSWLAADSPLFIWNQLDLRGGLAIELPREDDDQTERRIADSIREYALAFEEYRITERPDRALRELLVNCRSEGIDAALFLMPERNRFQAAYPPHARREIESYLATLRDDYGCRVLDATQWCGPNDFLDGHHLLAQGARRFSRRFGAYLLAPPGPPSLPAGRRPPESAADVARRGDADPVPLLR
ncbi:MAG TPA: hypothetical protein VGN42_17420 [Pirellulales bacterium]|jgi:hypothetical protein|nr:hypothetical protein [Pirellulales bacterium]